MTSLLPAPEVDALDSVVAQTIREEASAQGISRARLARTARVKESKLERCWHDAGDYTLPELARIAKALDVAPAYFYGVRPAAKPVHMPTADESGVTVIPIALMGRDAPRPGERVQVTTTQDPRRGGYISYHLSKDIETEGSSWVSDCNVTATVGGIFTFLGVIDTDRERYALLGLVPTDDGNRDD